MKDRKLYLVPYAHLDTQWRWTYVTTIIHYLKKTLHENFRLFEKYPGYCFNFTGAIRYGMMKDYYPEEYEKLKSFIKEGRWKIAGSCLDETDANVPSPESLIRNILYGNNFFRREFNAEAYDYMLPDCFGFPASLPAILTHCGIEGFSTQKLTWHSAAGIPFAIGMWKGPDGSRLPAAFNPSSYMSKLFRPPGRSRKWLKRINEHGRQYDVWKDYRYYGTGDTGGAPWERSVKNAEKSLRGKGIVVCQDSSDRFFKDLTPQEKGRLPEYSGDLLLTEHSAGTLTSQAIMKRWNRKNELLADAAERVSAAAWFSCGMEYPNERYAKAWQRVIGSQMHDILPGTSTPEAYTYSYNDEVIALNSFSSELKHGIEKIAGSLDTETEGVPLIIYNPLSFERKDIVEAAVPFPGKEGIAVFDHRDNEVPVQVVSGDGEKSYILFPASTPPLSWNVYSIREKTAAPARSLEPEVRETDEGIVLENRVFRVRINNEGFADSIYDKAQQVEILAGTVHYELQKETPAMFPAWNMYWKDRKKKPLLLTGVLKSIKITEKGPVRAAVEITRKFKESTFVQKISLTAGAAEERIEFTESIDWRLSGYSLKTAFPLSISSPEATYNWQVGKVRRTNNNEKKFEVPSHMWLDLTDRSGSRGVSILEDSKYGSDKPDDNTLRLTLLYTPGRRFNSLAFCDQFSQDWGRHTIRYALYSHGGDWREGKCDLEALRFNQPLYPFLSDPSPGHLGKSFSFISVSSDQVLVSALKFAENEDGVLILRLIEQTGRPCPWLSLSFPAEIEDAWEVNGQEIRTADAVYCEKNLETDILPYQVKAFALKLAGPSSEKETSGIKPLELPCNENLFTSNGERPDLKFSYPRELIPKKIVSGDICFTINKGGMDALACCGKEIPLGASSCNMLSMLTAAEEETTAVFTFRGPLDKEVKITIPAASGFIGQYDTRQWKRKSRWKKRDYFWRIPCTGVTPGYIKREEVAFYTTHTHSFGEDLPYQFGYMFRFDFVIPAGATAFRLCDNKKVKVFAITLSSKKTMAEPCRHLADEFDY